MSSNRILSRLSREDLALLEPHLEAVDLPARKSLEKRKKRIEQVYFIESGFASVVANGTSKPSIEVGIIGREGMTGLAVVLGHDRAQHDTFIQLPGKGMRMTVDSFREAQDRSVSLHREGHTGTRAAEHHAKKLMREGQLIAIDAVVRHQKPAR